MVGWLPRRRGSPRCLLPPPPQIVPPSWIRVFELNQLVVALAMWRLVIDKIKYQERTEMYHREAGGAKLREIMYRLQQRLMGKVMARLRVKIGWVVFEERSRAALLIQVRGGSASFRPSAARALSLSACLHNRPPPLSPPHLYLN